MHDWEKLKLVRDGLARGEGAGLRGRLHLPTHTVLGADCEQKVALMLGYTLEKKNLPGTAKH